MTDRDTQLREIRARWAVRISLMPAATQDTHDVVAMFDEVKRLREWWESAEARLKLAFEAHAADLARLDPDQ